MTKLLAVVQAALNTHLRPLFYITCLTLSLTKNINSILNSSSTQVLILAHYSLTHFLNHIDIRVNRLSTHICTPSGVLMVCVNTHTPTHKSNARGENQGLTGTTQAGGEKKMKEISSIIIACGWSIWYHHERLITADKWKCFLSCGFFHLSDIWSICTWDGKLLFFSPKGF